MKQIIALGGGGFSMEPANPLLDKYILNQSNKEKPKVCFVATASGDSADYIGRFYESFHRFNCLPTHLPLFKPTIGDLESFVLEQDIIYVGGGNTRNLIVLWKEWGLDTIFRKAWEKGVILTGLSAGSLCWFEEGVTDSINIDGPLTKLSCLGFLKGSHCPHYDGEMNRRPAFHKLILTGELKKGIAADDGVAIHFIDEEISKVVSSRPTAKAFAVHKINDSIIEEPIKTHYLGKYCQSAE